MEFQGQQHSGIDDARNIARVVMRMLGDGADLYANEKIFARRLESNKRICVDVMAVTREGSGDDDGASDEDGQNSEEVNELDCEHDDRANEVTYSYQGKAVSFKSPLNAEPAADSEVAGSKDEDDVSDLMYWMKLKQK